MNLIKTLYNAPIGSIILEFDEIASTNEKAHFFADQGFREGTVVIARKQTEGRGRRGSNWYSPEGGLYCSCILRPKVVPKDAWIFEKIAGIAAYQTIARIIDKRPQLKSPNDILICGKKAAGILIESRGGEARLDHLIAGIGINCSVPLDAFPPYIRCMITTLTIEAGYKIQVIDTLDILLYHLNYWYNKFYENKTEEISNIWEKLVVGSISCQTYY